MKITGTQKFAIFFCLIIMFVFIGSFFHFDQQQSREFFAQHSPILSSIIFVVLYVVGTFFIWFGPKDVLRVASLFIFGVVGSTVLVYIGEMLNMVTLFWFSRRLGRPFVEAKMKGRLKEIEESASRTSVPVIFFMKFYPIIPFRFLDLGYGLTKISFLKYAAVSMVAAPVRLYVVQYFLDLMIQFGLMAAKGNWDIFIQRYMDMTYYLVDRPPLFFSLMVYTFSAIIFFAVLMIRRHLRKKSLSQGLAAR